MKKLFITLALLCTSVMAQAQNEVTTTYNIIDDGYATVPLPFTFNFYNTPFTTGYMYDNGIISFRAPYTQGAINPATYNAKAFSSQQNSYFIAPLWADIAPVNITKYTTSTDNSSYIRFNWVDIAEYYSKFGNHRLNTFSTTLGVDGSIETHYIKINLQTSAISVGTVGDISKNEYNQIYYSPCCSVTNKNTIQDWYIAGAPIIEPEPTITVPTTEIIVPTTSDNVTTIEPTIVTTTIVETPTTTNNQPTESTQSIVVTTMLPDSSGNKTIDAQAVARNNQRNTNNLINSIVASSIENSNNQITNDVSTDTVTNTISSTSMVVVSSMDSTNNDQDIVNVNSTSTQSLSIFNRLAGAIVNDNIDQNISQDTANNLVEDNILSANNTNSYNITVPDEINPTSVRSLANMSATIKNYDMDEDKDTEQLTEIAGKNDLSEIATTGTQIEKIQLLPIGYSLYLNTVLKDASFYLPKEIYRNQTIVDNMPAQRLLHMASDIKFDEMVNEQYGEKQ